jgi:hypothetical protein
MIIAPVMTDVFVGRASHKKTIAKANPTGTRMRRAQRDHVLLAGCDGCIPGWLASLTLILHSLSSLNSSLHSI